jgi:transcriptional regulator with XRE-family HTH domain
MMSVDQCRAGRALLGWSAQALADAARVGVATVRRYETDNPMNAASIAAIEAALVAAGLTFLSDGETSTGGAGVRLTDPA